MAQTLHDITLHVDKNKIGHLIRILLTNAIENALPQSVITVEVELQKKSDSVLHSNTYFLELNISYNGLEKPVV